MRKGCVEVRTQPALVPLTHVLASVSGSFNAVLVNGDVVGRRFFMAAVPARTPPVPPSSATSARPPPCSSIGPRHSGFVPHGLYGKSKPIDETVSRYYLRLTVEDRARRGGASGAGAGRQPSAFPR
jgi:homoserine dehydrogenase